MTVSYTVSSLFFFFDDRDLMRSDNRESQNKATPLLLFCFLAVFCVRTYSTRLVGVNCAACPHLLVYQTIYFDVVRRWLMQQLYMTQHHD